MTDKPSDEGEKQRDRFSWLDLPDVIEMIDTFVRIILLMLRALWWLAKLVLKRDTD